MSSTRKSRSVRRSEKRLRVQPPLRAGVNAAPIRLPFAGEPTASHGMAVSRGSIGSANVEDTSQVFEAAHTCANGHACDAGWNMVRDDTQQSVGFAAPTPLASRPYESDLPWRTLGEWFEHRFGQEGLDLLARGDVLAGHNMPVDARYPYKPGERLWVFRPILDEPDQPIELQVVAENERYMVVDKPHGMATAPKGSHVAQTVLVAARRQFGNDLLVPAHRLDLETAGLLLLVKDPQWRGCYQKLFERRAITKTYRAVAPALDGAQLGDKWHSDLALRKADGQMRVEVLHNWSRGSMPELGSALSALQQEPDGFDGSYVGDHRRRRVRTMHHVVTDIELSELVCAVHVQAKQDALGAGADTKLLVGLGNDENNNGAHFGSRACDKTSLQVELNPQSATGGAEQRGVYILYPHTGFTHQLRVAMWQLGAPICGDPAYPEILSLDATETRPYPLQLLAASLDFVDPISGEHTHIESAQTLALEEA